MEKFSKGEWLVSDKEPGKFGDTKVNNVVKMPLTQPTRYGATMYLVVGGFEVSTQKDEVEANAHLIAAAPEMYQALKEIAELGIDDDCAINIDAVKMLLAKARGEK